MSFQPPILWATIAGAGGASRFLQQYLEGNEFSWPHLVAHLFISIFSGVMFGLVGQHFNFSNEITMAFAGLGGFMGIHGLDFLVSVMKKRIV